MFAAPPYHPHTQKFMKIQPYHLKTNNINKASPSDKKHQRQQQRKQHQQQHHQQEHHQQQQQQLQKQYQLQHMLPNKLLTLSHLIKQFFVCSCSDNKNNNKFYNSNIFNNNKINNNNNNNNNDNFFFQLSNSTTFANSSSSSHFQNPCHVIKTTLSAPSCLSVSVPLADCFQGARTCAKDSGCMYLIGGASGAVWEFNCLNYKD